MLISNNGFHSFRTVHRGFADISVGSQYTDLDFADDVAVLSEMLEILILSLEIMYYEALPFGLSEINWDKTNPRIRLQHGKFQSRIGVGTG